MTPAPWASHPDASRGRLHGERKETRGPRDAFQRDRDRIIHSISFRRLRHKTQVFLSPDGDHFRVRLTHSLEVARRADAAHRLDDHTDTGVRSEEHTFEPTHIMRTPYSVYSLKKKKTLQQNRPSVL